MRPGFVLRPPAEFPVISPGIAQQIACAQIEQLLGHREPQLLVPDREARCRTHGSRRIRPASPRSRAATALRRHGRPHRWTRPPPRSPHRCGTTRLQFGEQDSFSGDRCACVGVVQLRQQRGELGVVCAALDRERTLSRRWQHLHRLESLGDIREPSDAGQSRPGDHDAVEITVANPVQPGIKVAS